MSTHADPEDTAGERSDHDLLRAHVDGDADAFGELFARHRDRLWAVALRTMGNPEDAADGLQDGMIAAFRRAASFRGEAAVTTWLHRVVVNACLDRLRAAKIRRFDSLPDDVEDRGTLVATATHDDEPEAPWSPPSADAGCWTRSAPCRSTSERRSSWSTWRDTPSPTSPRCSGVRRAR